MVRAAFALFFLAVIFATASAFVSYEKVTLQGQYTWEQLWYCDNTGNTEHQVWQGTYTSSTELVTRSLRSAVEERLNSHTKSASGGGGFSFSGFSVKGDTGSSNVGSFLERTVTDQSDSTTRTTSSTVQVTATAGAGSKLSVYQLVFSMPGVRIHTSTIAQVSNVADLANLPPVNIEISIAVDQTPKWFGREHGMVISQTGPSRDHPDCYFILHFHRCSQKPDHLGGGTVYKVCKGVNDEAVFSTGGIECDE